MKTQKIYKIMPMALMLSAALLSITSVDADAKAKVYKAKTVKVAFGKSKTVTTSKKIKKVAICSTNKSFTVKKTGNKKFKVSGTDKGKTQTVKVTYTNKYTQKFKINTKAAKTTGMPSYAKKIVNELKPLLANPDNGLKTVLAQWEKRNGYPKNGYSLIFRLYDFEYGTDNTKSYTVEEVINEYTASQKKALILEVYFRQRMTYGLDGHKRTESYWYNRNSNAFFKLLYEGKFWGMCGEGAVMAYDICQYLDIKSTAIGSTAEMNHGWCGIWVTDKNGVSYWHGIYTTSYGRNMKADTPIGKGFNLTKKQVETYMCKPNSKTNFVILGKTKTNNSTTTPATTPEPTGPRLLVPTPAPAQTQTPAATTEPTKAPVVSQEPQVTQEPAPTEQPTVAPTVQPTTAPTVTPTVVPTETPAVTPEPTVEPTTEPAPAPQRIMIPHDEHNYTCTGCNVSPYRHKDSTNPYITNFTKNSNGYTVYAHNYNGIIRYFDANGNEYIDINGDGSIMDELIQLAG